MPRRGLTQDGHGKEFSLGGEAVLCVVIHETMFVPTGAHRDMALQTHTRTWISAQGVQYVACLCLRNGFTLWDFIQTNVKLTILLRRVLWIERLYIIWGYSHAMETAGVWSLG